MRAFGLAQIILADQHQLAPVHAAGLVELVEVDLDAVHGELAVDVDRPRERPKRAHLYFRIGDPWNAGSLRLRVERGDGGEGRVAVIVVESRFMRSLPRVHASRRQVGKHSTACQCASGRLPEPPLDRLTASITWMRLASLGRRELAWQICRKPGGLSMLAGRATAYSAACPRCGAASRPSRSSASATDMTSAYFSDMSKRLTACDTWLRS